MKILFVEKKAMELRYERSCLLLYHEGKRLSSVPLAQLEHIIVAPHVALSAGVLGLVAEKNVSLMVVNNRYPDRTALLSGQIKGDVQRRLDQFKLHQSDEFRLKWSIHLVRLKIIRQCKLLMKLRARRPELNLILSQSLAQLMRQVDAFSDNKPQDLSELRGREGAAAALFFKAYTQVFAPILNFTGRNRRPPRDPVNVCLSLAYTLCYQEAVNAVKIVGLDPALGCLHEPYYNRQSLACDLMEPLRPLIDYWVYGLFQSKTVRLEDFTITDICLLQASGKKRFYEAFRMKAPALRCLLRRYARDAANIVSQHEQSLH